ncbi:PhoX family protein [Hymenobacter aerilatus]|uniref:PhoX family protein n=1 Tax=Hymenobacter aerilatus TaxID=2932251 RepID=A0A8T9SWN8_9BACT|nr:PhoX family protein [Hymenobacter aerilatus]UOR06642.1 PhoX family protein [Hymenobacter aerilatus]
MTSKLPALLVLALLGCNDDNNSADSAPEVQLQAYSVNPALVKTLSGFESLEILPLISSDDKLPESPDFIFGAQPDGSGLLRNPNGEGYVLINNHEIMWSVSRVYLDKTFKPVKGEYILDGDGGGFRLCSATLATPQEHGFGPTFLTAGETDGESMVHALDPLGPINKKDRSRMLPALGKASMENAVPLPKDAYPGKTMIIIGEDNSDGQLVAYLSNTVGDLQNGKLYFLKRTNGNPVETDMVAGQQYDVEFVEIDNAKTSTGAQIAAQSLTKSAIQFARVEDIDYRKGGNGAGRELYFTATGVSQSNKVTPVTGKTMWGRVYRLQLDASNALKGKLEVVADGSTDPGNSIVNPDNLCVTQNFVYIQEDGDSYYKENKHDGRVWQYNIGNKQLKPMLEMDHRRNDPTFQAKYNKSNDTRLSSWEYGAMQDISDIVGVPNTFLLNLHPHTWQDDKYLNADGSNETRNKNKEGGQVVIVRGVQQ